MPEYKSITLLDNLQDTNHEYIDLSQDIKFWLEFVAFPEDSQDNITGIVVITYDGDLCAIWLTESNRPYDLYSWYRPLPFYIYDSLLPYKDKLPVYWQESNEYYCR